MENLLIKQAFNAYNSPSRNNFQLHGEQVSNLYAVNYYLTQALLQAPKEQHTDIAITMANIETFRGQLEQAIDYYEQALLTANTQQRDIIHCYLATWYHFFDQQARSDGYLKKLTFQCTTKNADVAIGATNTLAIIERKLSQSIQYQHEIETAAPHAIVTLGYKLNGDGTIAKPLALRLEATRSLALLSPNSLIIVTGGVKTAGKTEAEQMEQWLINHGIAGERIIKEDQAANTIENAHYSLNLLHKHQIKHATLISASIHVHRSQILFEVIQSQHKDSNIAFNHLAVSDGLSPSSFPTGQIRINCYIDALRGYGLPAFRCGSLVQV
ncbi:YdcF family protein [Photobacterium minamisatsumaniensis]|uniref:YdcF family protein n=1 Tax=Photobacterium minamisatsumaniensis TaxID=2910233 RepID=UPI003D0D556F